jgi:hypothetical protein
VSRPPFPNSNTIQAEDGNAEAFHFAVKPASEDWGSSDARGVLAKRIDFAAWYCRMCSGPSRSGGQWKCQAKCSTVRI